MEDKMLGEILCLSSHWLVYCLLPSVFACLLRLHCRLLSLLLATDLTEHHTQLATELTSTRNSIQLYWIGLVFSVYDCIFFKYSCSWLCRRLL